MISRFCWFVIERTAAYAILISTATTYAPLRSISGDLARQVVTATMQWFRSWKGASRFLTATMFQSRSSVITRRNRNGPNTNSTRIRSMPRFSAPPTAASSILSRTSSSPTGTKPDGSRSYPELNSDSIEIPSSSMAIGESFEPARGEESAPAITLGSPGWRKWHGRLVEHPYHAWAAAALKAEDDAG